MIKMGTIMVRSDKGVPVQAMVPKVQRRATRTEPVGINTDRTSLKSNRSTRAMMTKVAGGSCRKSLSV